MPYFTHTEKLYVIHRQHEFNAEALDGRIELIPDTEPCYIIAHYPNKQWSYNVGWIEKTTPGLGWDNLNLMGRKKEDKPSLYYEMVPINFYEKYISQNKFELKIEVQR